MKKKGLVILAICSMLTQAVGIVSASDEIGVVREESFNEETDVSGIEEGITESLEAGIDDYNLEEFISDEDDTFEIDAVSVTETAEQDAEEAWESLDEEEYEVGEEVLLEEELFDVLSEEAADVSAEDEMPLAGESWGTNLKWKLSDGWLSITGSGAMSECDPLDEEFEEKDSNLFPWGNRVDEIRQVTIGDGVTSISPAAFFGCEELQRVTIGKAVTSIGEQAFRNAVNLEKVTFSIKKEENIKNHNELPTLIIDRWAFDGCESLDNLELPFNTIAIMEGAFDGCFGLKELDLGKKLLVIGYEAFSGCASLYNVNLPKTLLSIGDRAFEDCCEFSQEDEYDENDYMSIHFHGDFPVIKDENGNNIEPSTSHLFSNDLVCVFHPENNKTYTEKMKKNRFFAEAMSSKWVPENYMVIVSLGDSYSSGEGIEPFYGQYEELSKKVNNLDWLAHRSTKSWPGLLEVPGIEGTMSEYWSDQDPLDLNPYPLWYDCKWYFKASSGATTQNIYQNEQKKEVRQEGINDHKMFYKYLPIQLDVFDEIDEEVDYVTLTIGGNDVDFAGIIKNCVLEPTYITGSRFLQHKFDKLWENIDQTKENIENTYKAIKNKVSPDTIIIVAGYPQLLDPSGRGWSISYWEANYVNWNVSKFNNVIKGIVQKCQSEMNITFVDVEDKFATHEAYSEDPWIKSVTLFAQNEDLDDKTKASAYSMHPTEAGARAYAERVNETIEAFEKQRN